MPAPDAYESIIPDEPIPVAPNPPEVEIDDPVIAGAEVMTIVNRMLDHVPDDEHMLSTIKTWSDNPKTAWYYEAVQEATSEHIYVNAFFPPHGADMTREEALMMIIVSIAVEERALSHILNTEG